jgi:DNA-binding Lrp family transcriptional regulator
LTQCNAVSWHFALDPAELREINRGNRMNITRQQSQLLRLLQLDASLSHEALAEKVCRSRQAVGRDLKELEENGVIERKTIVVDAQKIGLTTTVYVLVELRTHGDGHLDRFESTVREHFPNVIEFAHILGSWDLLLKFVVRDSTHLAEVQRKLTNTPNVSRTRSYGSIGAPRQYPLPIGDDVKCF